MFHTVSSLRVLSDYELYVLFSNGEFKYYDMKPLFRRWVQFRELEKDPMRFLNVKIDVGGYGIVWSDLLDLSCEELYENGR